MRHLRNPLLWTSAQHLLICFGIVYVISFFAGCHWYFYFVAPPFIALGWFILYRFERGLLFRYGRLAQ